jgi:transposase
VAAVDATGLETRHVSTYFGLRRGGSGHRQRAWPKLTAVVHTHSHLILGAVPSVGPSQDSPDFAPAVRQATALLAFEAALADAAYDAEHNHRLCREECGMRRSVIALNSRNAGRRWPKTPHRRAMRRHFPRALYHQRWHAESGFSQHKRRLGSALSARSGAAQAREIILRVLTHNLMLLRSPTPGFQQSKRLSKPAVSRPNPLIQLACRRFCFSLFSPKVGAKEKGRFLDRRTAFV